MANRPVQKETSRRPHFLQFNNLACETAGGKVIFATDEWFAPARNLLKRDPPEFIATAFTEYGKWMDGWETRRKRIPGHDWCIIQLGVPGIIHGFDVDTSFFTGNYAPYTSIQAACLDQMPSFTLEGDRTGMAASPSQFKAVEQLNSDSWEELVPITKLKPGYSESCHNYLNVTYPHRVTHIRINIYPGIGRADNMGDGWESARRLDRPKVLKVDEKGILQVPGFEWAILRLGHPGIISKIEVDTNHFKGNFPDSCQIEACCLTPDEENNLIRNQWCSDKTPKWRILLPPHKLKAHHRHMFSGESVVQCGPVTHVRLVIAPDGGVSRLRLWGRPVSNNMTRPQQISKL
ncbi:allantoicase isoform X2 [Sinocyclocheilus rhinocerous]|uniref:allantoicase isoform X2 n=1 Tax=Sinocyclocheilus rhinocerous TaxID=307959 RepID=UPI0007B7C33D|nr:PREDICTED: allantoicase isoform X2 [Sinocyclocheilus rhinocerous]